MAGLLQYDVMSNKWASAAANVCSF